MAPGGGGSLREHRRPRQVGGGGEELGVGSVVERGGLGEVGVRLIVTAKDGGEAAETMADWAVSGNAGSGELIGPRREPLEQRPGVPRVATSDRSLGVGEHS